MHSYKDLGRIERISGAFHKIFIPGSFFPFHVFTAPDFGLPHCHVSDMEINMLYGGYEEEQYTIHEDGRVTMEVFQRLPNTTWFVPARTIHRITKLYAEVAITRPDVGPPFRNWAHYDFRPEGIFFKPAGENDFRPFDFANDDN